MSWDRGTRKRIAPLLAGVVGGGVSTILLYPLDLCKVRLQVNESARRIGILSTLRGVIHHEGFFGLYQGIIPAILGNAISWGGYFFFYERIKLELLERRRNQESRMMVSLGHWEMAKWLHSNGSGCHRITFFWAAHRGKLGNGQVAT